MRGGSASLALDDVRAMLRLVHELHEMPPDPLARKAHLLESLCRLVPADAGAALVARRAPPAPPDRPLVLTAVYAGGLTWTADAIAPPWGRLLRGAGRGANVGHGPAFRTSGRCTSGPLPTPTVGTIDAPRQAGHCLYSLLPLAGADARLVACLSLRRDGRGRRPFSRRDRDLVHALHLESRWLYRHDVPLAAPTALALAPRPRETLRLLLAGHGEKQIAARLRLSTNTVHHYVKTVYRHFGVSSRSELLARWVKEG